MKHNGTSDITAPTVLIDPSIKSVTISAQQGDGALTKGVVGQDGGKRASHHGAVHGVLEELKWPVNTECLDIISCVHRGPDLD